MDKLLTTVAAGAAALAAPGAALAEGDLARGAEIYRSCIVCHSLQPGVHLTGPSLADFTNRPAGTAEGFERYSDDLREAAFDWDANTLNAFLADPRAMFPGTYMTFPGIDHAEARTDLIAFLKTATAPGAAQELVQQGLVSEELVQGQMPPPLGDAPPQARVAAIRHCADTFFVTTEAGAEVPFWEKNVRIKIDSTETGPPEGVPVLLGAGMQGDRVSVVFDSVDFMQQVVEEKC